MSRILPAVVVALLVGAGVGAGTVAVWATVGVPSQCVASQAVATLPTLTPLLILNSPYLGHANGTWTTYDNTSGSTSSMSATSEASNGTTVLLLETINWTIWTTRHVGYPGSCAGIFAYTSSLGGGWMVVATGVNYTSDSRVPTYVGTNSSWCPPCARGSYAPVYFNDSYVTNTGVFHTCGGGSMAAGSRYLDLRIPFDYLGETHWADITFDTFTNYTYSFPSTGGSWSYDTLSNPPGPGGGMAFSYQGRACCALHFDPASFPKREWFPLGVQSLGFVRERVVWRLGATSQAHPSIL